MASIKRHLIQIQQSNAILSNFSSTHNNNNDWNEHKLNYCIHKLQAKVKFLRRFTTWLYLLRDNWRIPKSDIDCIQILVILLSLSLYSITIFKCKQTSLMFLQNFRTNSAA